MCTMYAKECLGVCENEVANGNDSPRKLSVNPQNFIDGNADEKLEGGVNE